MYVYIYVWFVCVQFRGQKPGEIKSGPRSGQSSGRVGVKLSAPAPGTDPPRLRPRAKLRRPRARSIRLGDQEGPRTASLDRGWSGRQSI